MKVLWVNTNFMHPTTKGGQIRTLEMLRCLHRWHQIHYVAIEKPGQPEGLARAAEYSDRAYPFQHKIPDKTSPAFARQLLGNLFSKVPLPIARFHPPGMRQFLEDLIRRERFDAAVVDYLTPSGYFPDRAGAVLFQHNVEFTILKQHAEHARDPLRRAYFQLQADRMFEFERQACRDFGHVVACSESDANLMRESFGISHVSDVPTGVNLEYFTRPGSPQAATSKPDIVFVGSMDWLPNQQGVLWFVREILPLIQRLRPNTTFAVVGRLPPPSIIALAEDPLITVTGTVADIRPWFWESTISVVPLLAGSGTRLKIYEAMAAKTAVVSTAMGAEGLEYRDGENIAIADTPESFARNCIHFIEDDVARRKMTQHAWEMVRTKHSWESVARQFERILLAAPKSLSCV